MSDAAESPPLPKSATKRRPKRPPGRPPHAPGKHMTTAQQAEACALWAAGEATLADLAKRFRKHPDTLKKLFDRRGVKKGQTAAKVREAVTAAVAESMFDDVSVLAARVKETKETHYKLAEALTRLTHGTLAKAQQEGRAFGTIVNDMKALKAAAEILRITREERYAVLGLNEQKHHDDDELPDLVVKELTAEQIVEMNRISAQQAGTDEYDMDELDFGSDAEDFEEVPDELDLLDVVGGEA